MDTRDTPMASCGVSPGRPHVGVTVTRTVVPSTDASREARMTPVAPDATVIDPGFGFSKTVEQNILLFDRLDALAASEVVVYPSRDEVFGLVAVEALMCGTPVIVGNDSGCGEIICSAWSCMISSGMLRSPSSPSSITGAEVTLTADFFTQKACEIVLLPTPQVIGLWNETEGRAAGLFHVTC